MLVGEKCFEKKKSVEVAQQHKEHGGLQGWRGLGQYSQIDWSWKASMREDHLKTGFEGSQEVKSCGYLGNSIPGGRNHNCKDPVAGVCPGY